MLELSTTGRSHETNALEDKDEVDAKRRSRLCSVEDAL